MGFPMMRFWMAHWEFIYLPVALIYKIFSTPYTILIIQTIAVAFGALPLYWLAKEKLNDGLASIIFPISYLLYPAIQNANLCDVHGVTFAAPFLLFTFYYLQKRDNKKFIIFAIIALCCREDSALIIFMMGLYSFFIMKDRKLGSLIVIVGLSWFFIWYERMAIRSLFNLPAFNIMEGADTHWSHVGNIKSDPLYLIKFLAKKYNINYFFYLFGPVALLSFFSPTTLLIASPIFAINLLSSYFYTHDIEHYYSSTIAPFIFISAIYGANNLFEFLQSRRKFFIKFNYILFSVLGLSLFFFFIKSNVFDVKKWKVTEHHKIIKKIIKTIPKDASVSAEVKLAVHAAERHEIYVFNDNVNTVDYILYDFYAPEVNLITRKSFTLPYAWPNNDSILKVIENPEFGIVHYEDGICLLKRNAPFGEGLCKLALASSSEIKNKINLEIFSGIHCKGYNIFNTLRYYYSVEKLGGIYWKRSLHFTCFWNTDQELSENYIFKYKIQNRDQVFYKEFYPVYSFFPTSIWKTDDLIRDEIFWEIPETAKPGEYQVSVCIISDKNKEAENDYSYLFNIQLKDVVD